MEYELDINGKCISLEVAPLKGGQARVVMEGKSHDLEYQRISESQIQIRVNGRQVHAWVRPERDGKAVFLNNRYYFIKDRHLQDQAGSGPVSQDGAAPLTPPMPAIVIQVPVAVGDRVKKGDAVVVVSAMKMETTLAAPYSGTITRITVKEGDKVMPGDILADIDPEGESQSLEEVA